MARAAVISPTPPAAEQAALQPTGGDSRVFSFGVASFHFSSIVDFLLV